VGDIAHSTENWSGSASDETVRRQSLGSRLLLGDIGETVERFLSEEEEKCLRAVLEADITAHAKHPVLRDEAIERLLEFDISLRSGMRKSEQYNLCRPDLDYKRRIMRLKKTKNGKPRNAFLIDDTIRVQAAE
jgi:integrase